MRPCSKLAAALAALALLPAAALAQPTPTPGLQPGSPCPAVVELSWDVSSLQGAERIRRRIVDAASSDVLDSTLIGEPVGVETIDLRTFGAVLDGTVYELQVRAKAADGTNLGGWSEAVSFSVSMEAGSVDLAPVSGDPYGVSLSWTSPAAIAACAAELGWEVAAGPFAVPDGEEPGRLDAGTLASASGTTPIDLSAHGDGERWFRLYATGPAGYEVGSRGTPSSISVGALEAIAVTVTVRDLAAATCAPGAPAGYATVTATSGADVRTAQAGSDGVASLSLDERVWDLSATRSDCGASAGVSWDGAGSPPDVAIDLPGCDQPPPDLAVAIDLERKEFLPITVPVSVVNDGAGPAPAGTIDVERAAGKTSPRTVSPGRPPKTAPVGSAAFPALCPGGSAEAEVPDPGARPGAWVYVASVPGDRATVEVEVADATAADPVEPAPGPALDLALSAEQSHETLTGGDTMTYTVSLANAGQADLYNVVVRLHVSTNLDFEGATGSHGFDCDPGATNFLGLEVLCEGGDLVAGATATITVQASMPASANAGHDLTFVARADPDEVVDEVDESNNHRVLHATTAELALSTYEVTDTNGLAEYAADRGYGIEIEVARQDKGVFPDTYDACTRSEILSGDGGEWLSLKADGGTLSVHVECVYRILVPEPLATGWSVEDVDTKLARVVEWPRGWDPSCRVERVDSDGAGIVIRVVKPAGPAPAPGGLSPGRRATCWVTAIELSGPAGGSWQDAFD